MLKRISSVSFAVFFSVVCATSLATGQDTVALGQLEYVHQHDAIIVGQSNAALDHVSISLVEFVDAFGNVDYGLIEIEEDGAFILMAPSSVTHETNTGIAATMVEPDGSDSVAQLLLLFVPDDKLTLPEDPDDLDDDWEEQTEQAPNRRTFKHKTSGITIHFDKGVEGSDGWAGKDHWHIKNPKHKKSDGKKGFYLDKDGNPVNKGSDASHILPGTEVCLPSTSTENDVQN